MSLSLDGKRLRLAIKNLMKKNGQTYTDLANALKISVPTVKRMLTRDDLPLERMISIANWLGITFSELVELANLDDEKLEQFTEQQEEFFIKNPRVLLYFHLLLSGWSNEEIIQKFNFTQRETEKCKFALEKINLAELWPEGRLRLKTTRHHKMIPGGKLESTYFRKIVDSIYHTICNRVPAYSDAKGLESPTLFRPFEIVMQEDTYLEMTRELSKTIEKYRSIGGKQVQLEPREHLKHVSGIIVADFYYCWSDILNK